MCASNFRRAPRTYESLVSPQTTDRASSTKLRKTLEKSGHVEQQNSSPSHHTLPPPQPSADAAAFNDAGDNVRLGEKGSAPRLRDQDPRPSNLVSVPEAVGAATRPPVRSSTRSQDIQSETSPKNRRREEGSSGSTGGAGAARMSSTSHLVATNSPTFATPTRPRRAERRHKPLRPRSIQALHR